MQHCVPASPARERLEDTAFAAVFSPEVISGNQARTPPRQRTVNGDAGQCESAIGESLLTHLDEQQKAVFLRGNQFCARVFGFAVHPFLEPVFGYFFHPRRPQFPSPAMPAYRTENAPVQVNLRRLQCDLGFFLFRRHLRQRGPLIFAARMKLHRERVQDTLLRIKVEQGRSGPFQREWKSPA